MLIYLVYRKGVKEEMNKIFHNSEVSAQKENHKKVWPSVTNL